VIGRGECRDFLVRFNPIIPASTSPNVNQTAAQVLPDSVMSKIKVELNDSSVGDVNLVGHVRTAVKLIDGNNPKNPPVIKFERSGNELTATYYIYDSNRDVQIAEYKFFDGAGNTVPLTPVTASLKDIIENRKVRIGQSFTIVQKFTNANERPETKNILVKISDGETSVSAMSGAVRVITGAAKTSSLRNSRGETLVLPTVRLSPQKSEQRKKYE
jgi:hypothetical protein